MMKRERREKLASYVNPLHRHSSEAGGTYDDVVTLYDGFARVWDQYIAAPALAHLNTLLLLWVNAGAVVLDAGVSTGERTLAILEHDRPKEVTALDASIMMLFDALGRSSQDI